MYPPIRLYFQQQQTFDERAEMSENATSGSRLRHSITSSARNKYDAGIVSPIALAVLRLMTISYLVGSCRRGGFGRMGEPDIGWCVWMVDERDAFDWRCNLMEYLQPFTADGILVIGETSRVTAWPFNAGGEATSDRVADKHEYNGYAA